ncbi:MAG TPA: M20/M25/M40 family metallo-hydrolase [Planctomycetota bacterium]|nr:M20/M25/M40 family metallo-hydrolase [Planctomycetota bacterium]
MTSPSLAPQGPPAAAWLLDRTEALCAADTTTGREDEGLPALRSLLTELGAKVVLQPVAPGRNNVLATWGAPRLLFSTHLDTVPPYLPPRRHGDLLHGRGTCDAKGQIVAQLGAIVELLARGHGGFAWLGVVGEETDSIGAAAAVALAPQLQTCVAAINGEPTENALATGQRGSLQLRLRTAGVAAHSGTPELGRSAIWPLLDWLQRLRELPQRQDRELGPEIWNLGTLRGGSAPNVVPAQAEAVLFVRSLPDSQFLSIARELAPADGSVEELSHTPPDRFTVLQGFPHATVTFGSDAPRLRAVIGGRQVVLCGPGSIKVAHTQDEFITGNDLQAGCRQLIAMAEAMLRSSS